MKNEKMIDQEALREYVKIRFERNCLIKAGIIGIMILSILMTLGSIFGHMSDGILTAFIGFFWIALCIAAATLMFLINNGANEKKKMYDSLSSEEKMQIIIAYKQKITKRV
ncbi:MAG: hypothetical protein WCJ45_00800 [bacterium]